MTRQEALISLNLVADIGSIRLGRLLEYFGTPQDILSAPREALMRVGAIGEKIAGRITAVRACDIERELSYARKAGVAIITRDDASYPVNLKQIPDPPIVLYVRGALKETDALSVAIVGSRRASVYGAECAGRFAGQLAECGITIVSGLARGIDTCAHRGALRRSGRTIAVIGSGFNRMYPEENAELVEEICRKGAVISEFPFDTPPLRQNFPRRNRVISGLSLGVLVVEAARTSGALITAESALEQGREVFALPGKVDAPNSWGTNLLIKDGAKLVVCVEDILEEIGSALPQAPLPKAAGEDPAYVRHSHEESPDLNGLEQHVFGAVGSEATTVDEILERAHLDYATGAPILLGLQMKKIITQLPGHQFRRVLARGITSAE
jgi:DNA processing protein